MKKSYQSPSTLVLTVETGILCASGGGGQSYISPKGGLGFMDKGSGSW